MIFINRLFHPVGTLNEFWEKHVCGNADVRHVPEMNESPRPIRFTGFGPVDYEEFEGEFCRDCLRPELRCRCQRGDA